MSTSWELPQRPPMIKPLFLPRFTQFTQIRLHKKKIKDTNKGIKTKAPVWDKVNKENIYLFYNYL
jgi:hypothetical protein